LLRELKMGDGRVFNLAPDANGQVQVEGTGK
jgi:hypothetical protein